MRSSLAPVTRRLSDQRLDGRIHVYIYIIIYSFIYLFIPSSVPPALLVLGGVPRAFVGSAAPIPAYFVSRVSRIVYRINMNKLVYHRVIYVYVIESVYLALRAYRPRKFDSPWYRAGIADSPVLYVRRSDIPWNE